MATRMEKLEKLASDIMRAESEDDCQATVKWAWLEIRRLQHQVEALQGLVDKWDAQLERRHD